MGHAQSVWTAVPNKSTEPSTEAEAQAATQAEGGREPLEPEGPLSLRGSIFFSGSLCTASVGFESGLYTPGFFLPSGSWVRFQVWNLLFSWSGSTDFVFCPPFCFGASSPGLVFVGGSSALARHACSRSLAWGVVFTTPLAAPRGFCPSLTLIELLCY